MEKELFSEKPNCVAPKVCSSTRTTTTFDNILSSSSVLLAYTEGPFFSRLFSRTLQDTRILSTQDVDEIESSAPQRGTVFELPDPFNSLVRHKSALLRLAYWGHTIFCKSRNVFKLLLSNINGLSSSVRLVYASMISQPMMFDSN